MHRPRKAATLFFTYLFVSNRCVRSAKPELNPPYLACGYVPPDSDVGLPPNSVPPSVVTVQGGWDEFHADIESGVPNVGSTKVGSPAIKYTEMRGASNGRECKSDATTRSSTDARHDSGSSSEEDRLRPRHSGELLIFYRRDRFPVLKEINSDVNENRGEKVP